MPSFSSLEAAPSGPPSQTSLKFSCLVFFCSDHFPTNAVDFWLNLRSAASPPRASSCCSIAPCLTATPPCFFGATPTRTASESESEVARMTAPSRRTTKVVVFFFFFMIMMVLSAWDGRWKNSERSTMLSEQNLKFCIFAKIGGPLFLQYRRHDYFATVCLVKPSPIFFPL